MRRSSISLEPALRARRAAARAGGLSIRAAPARRRRRPGPARARSGAFMRASVWRRSLGSLSDEHASSCASTSTTTWRARPAGSSWPSARAGPIRARSTATTSWPSWPGRSRPIGTRSKRIMDDLGFRAIRPKNAVGWLAEKAGRLKPNGQLTRLLAAEPAGRAGGPGARGHRKAVALEGAADAGDDEPKLALDRLERAGRAGRGSSAGASRNAALAGRP